MNNKRAFMVESLNEAKKELIRQADLNKQLNESKKIEQEKYRQAFTYAANYYNDDRIDEIHKKSNTILKTNDFDPDVLKMRFSNTATIELSLIEFLIKREVEIERFEQDLAKPSLSGENKNKLKEWLINLVDNTLNGSSSNDY